LIRGEIGMKSRGGNVKIDIYTHWWPRKAAQRLLEKAKAGSDPISVKYLERRESRTAVNDLDLRFRFMDRRMTGPVMALAARSIRVAPNL
jgi:hypothetical protein